MKCFSRSLGSRGTPSPGPSPTVHVPPVTSTFIAIPPILRASCRRLGAGWLDRVIPAREPRATCAPPPCLNDRGLAGRGLGAACGRLGDSCGHTELSRRDANEALEVMGELALIREPGIRRDLCQR